MIVYHGSRIIVNKPDIYHSRDRVDFGKGFYVTPLYDQAKRLCYRYKGHDELAYISKYDFDEKVMSDPAIKVQQFEEYSEEWLDFVMLCRRGEDKSVYDIVVGGVANDKVFDTIELYFQNLITKDAALGRLQYEKPNLQICIRTQKVLDNYLKFQGSEEI